MTTTQLPQEGDSVTQKLSTLDRHLPLWIGLAMGVGLLVGLVALGIAVSGNGPQVGQFLASLITS